MSTLNFDLNDRHVTVNVSHGMTALWVLREILGMRGTKFSCTAGLCGCCTIHVDDVATRACLLPASDIEGKRVRTIEGLAGEDGLHPLQQAWIDHRVPQCGYCQPGQLMSASALLEQTPAPTDAEIDAAMAGNLCRCGTYPRIKAAIRSVAAGAGQKSEKAS